MWRALFRFGPYRLLLLLASMPLLLSGLFRRETGRAYGVGLWAKLRLAARMALNNLRIVSATNVFEHVAMAVRILTLPPGMEGVVVECGCYKGASTANLSLVCALAGRKLHVFDSFAGLPEPGERDRRHLVLDSGRVHTYGKGAYAGALEEVKGNIARGGDLSVCVFHPGYFEETLPGFDRKTVFVFLDVDLISSMETCLLHLWPLLREGCHLFTHEAHHLEIARLFYLQDWWRENLEAEPPGLVGAGTGLGLVPGKDSFRSGIGYAVKGPSWEGLTEVPQEG